MTAQPRSAGPPIAIVGMSVLLPGAPDLDSYWRNLVGGVDAITDVPAHRWDPEFYDPTAPPERADRVYCKRGGFVDDYAAVDVAGFGIMPNSVAGAEPDQLLALRVAAEAIADAGGRDRLPSSERVGVVLGRGGYFSTAMVRVDQRVRTANQLTRTLAQLLPGVTATQLEQVRAAFAEQLGPASPDAAIGLVPNLAASRIANRLDLRGPAYTVDAACASSLVAVDQAVTELATGRCDVMLAGGVHHCHDITFWSVFSQLGALSRAQRIRPFDRAADGILIGEGTGVVVLKRLDDALAAGDRVYAVVRGSGVASDGGAKSLFSPESGGQVLALRRAWQAAGLDPREPDSIGLLEAHGTATVVGDGTELTTLAEVFGPGHPAVIGSVKSMIGHTMPAAGVAGLVKTALALHHRTLLPTLHCDDPHPQLAQTRFRPIATAETWEDGPLPRRAAVDAFGFGGINAHVVLEEAPSRTPARVRRSRTATPGEAAPREDVVLLSASDPTALAARLAAGERDEPAAPAAGPCRLAIVDPTPKKLALAARVLAKGVPWRGRSDVWFSPAPLLHAGGRTAFVFPGLEADFAPRLDDVRALLSDDDTVGVDVAGEDDYHGAVRHGVYVIGIGRLLERALSRIGVRPDAVAGYSVGEWSAMISAGMYSGHEIDRFLDDFDPDSLQVPGLVFAAVGTGADSPAVTGALARFGEVTLSHDNSPNQCVLCGPQEQIAGVIDELRAGGVLCQELPFRSGFHTPMLTPYLAPISTATGQFALHPPRVPTWSATTVAPFPADPDEVRAIFLRHLVEPVRFRELIEALYADGVRVFVQVGTGQLASVIDDVLREHDHLAIAANRPSRSGLAQLLRVGAALWVEGAAVELGALTSHGSGAEQAAPVTTRTNRPPMRLDLGSALVDLPGPVLPALPVPALATTPAGEFAALEQLAAQLPAAAELSALLRETASGALALFDAVTAQPAGPPPAAPPGPVERTLHVSLDHMPYLADHCFFKQRDGWPELSDRWPVVPATTLIRLVMDAVEEAFPGRRAVGVRQTRFAKWLVAVPASDVPLTLTPIDGGVHARLGDYAELTVELADGFPSTPPEPMTLDDSATRPGPVTARELYELRWMFHGPRFQAITELGPIGEWHTSATFRAPAAPGALLDNVGQVLGYWIVASFDRRAVVFPVGVGRITFYGEDPAPGTTLRCLVAIRTLTDTELVADAQLLIDGRVWAQLEGWVDHRFESHPATRPVELEPERRTLSLRQPGGWALLHERWRELGSRELFMRNHLGSAERAEYDAVAPRLRRTFLLGRIAVKDAVRHHLLDTGAVDSLFPAEVRVGNDEQGRPHVSGNHTDAVPPLSVSLAHDAEVGVAIARPAGTRVGIDVLEIREHPDSTLAFALTDDERELLTRLAGGDRAQRALWFTRFFTAKEAAAKAEGTGLRGDPKLFRVLGVDGDQLTVTAGEHTYRVQSALVENPEDLPERHYVVAWTEYSQQQLSGTADRSTP